MTQFSGCRRLLLLSTALSLSLSPMLATALPTGGAVAQGSASISTAGTTTTITQSTSKAVINWTGFDTAAGETVQFNDPSASSVTLNRISGPATNFDGTLRSNGNVWLINQRGIAFNGDAQVNVGGLLATTSNITDANFMAGNYNFTPGNRANPEVSNTGTITVADAGLAALVAPRVVNSGTITANVGKIRLAGGDTYTVDLAGDGLINLQASPAITNMITNNTSTGTLNAEGGSVQITAAQASNVLDTVINLAGAVDAQDLTVSNQNGDVKYNSNQFIVQGASNLTLKASGSIILTADQGGPFEYSNYPVGTNFTLDANDTGAASGGAIYIPNGAFITTSGGNIVMGGGADPSVDPAVGTSVYTNGILLGNNPFFPAVALESDGGNIILNGKGAASATTGDVDGVKLVNTFLVRANSIVINGTGGMTANGSSNGISYNGYVDIGGNSISMNGTGGNASGHSADGIRGYNAPDPFQVPEIQEIISTEGDISMFGQGGNSPGHHAEGVSLNSPFIGSNNDLNITGIGGTGLYATGVIISAEHTSNLNGNNVTITGLGGSASTGGSDAGVIIKGANDSTAYAQITNATASGTMSVNGTGGTSTDVPAVGDGVLIYNTLFNGGGLQITGVGANSPASDNYGIRLAGGDQAILDGDFGVTGTGSFGSAGFRTDLSKNPSFNTVDLFGGGNVTLTADTLNIVPDSFGPGGESNLIFAPKTLSTTVGVAGGDGTLQISADLLHQLSFNANIDVTIGNTADTGTMTIGAYNWTNNGNVSFLNGSGDIVLNGVNESTGSITLATLTGNFINNAGAGALLPDGGRFLIYTSDPSKVTLDGVTTDFQQFGCTFGDSCSGLPPTGNGLVFSSNE